MLNFNLLTQQTPNVSPVVSSAKNKEGLKTGYSSLPKIEIFPSQPDPERVTLEEIVKIQEETGSTDPKSKRPV